MSNQSPEDIYKDYWVDEFDAREKRQYYQRLYNYLRPKLTFKKDWKILDVAGGNGHNLIYLDIESADVIDISDSGLSRAENNGFNPIKGDICKRFPMDADTYDAAVCFEVLEHLHHPNKTLCEINNILKKDGILYVAQPNMKPDGKIHVRRYKYKELLDDLKKSQFKIEWTDFVPAYSMRDSILSDIRKNPSWKRKLIQTINLSLSFLPFSARYWMANILPNRFALMFVIKATKI